VNYFTITAAVSNRKMEETCELLFLQKITNVRFFYVSWKTRTLACW